MTIKDAAVHILNEHKKPLFVEDILERILSKKLYLFGAKDALSVLKIEIARSCDNMNYSKEYTIKLFHLENDGRFSLLKNN